jgi:hypothetical protein
MRIIGHRQISTDWHQLTTAHGVFFGYSEQQVREKAAAAHRGYTLAMAQQRNVLPLLPRQAAVRIA